MGRISLLDHGYLEVVETYGSEERIIEAARMSTGKGFKGWGPKCRSCGGDVSAGEHLAGDCPAEGEEPGDEKLLRYLYEHKHRTPFEMAGAIIEVQAPIFVFREWHRHRVPFGYNEASARYAPLPDVNYVPTVERLMVTPGGLQRDKQAQGTGEALTAVNADRFRRRLGEKYRELEELYQQALSVGVPKELARICLPVGRYSKMRATGNLRGWLEFVRLRLAPNAQHEIRVYADALCNELGRVFPRTMALFLEEFNREKVGL